MRVHATGLNFKDVLNVLGMYPGDPGPLGGECAGTVVAVGRRCRPARRRRVVALAPGASAATSRATPRSSPRSPDSVSFADAAGLLIATITADFALRHARRGCRRR